MISSSESSRGAGGGAAAATASAAAAARVAERSCMVDMVEEPRLRRGQGQQLEGSHGSPTAAPGRQGPGNALQERQKKKDRRTDHNQKPGRKEEKLKKHHHADRKRVRKW